MISWQRHRCNMPPPPAQCGWECAGRARTGTLAGGIGRGRGARHSVAHPRPRSLHSLQSLINAPGGPAAAVTRRRCVKLSVTVAPGAAARPKHPATADHSFRHCVPGAAASGCHRLPAAAAAAAAKSLGESNSQPQAARSCCRLRTQPWPTTQMYTMWGPASGAGATLPPPPPSASSRCFCLPPAARGEHTWARASVCTVATAGRQACICRDCAA